MNQISVTDGFIVVRIHKSITVSEMVKASASIGCILQADEHGLKIVKREQGAIPKVFQDPDGV